MLTGTNLLYTKQYNLRIVHEVIRLFGPVSRSEIARRTELTVQTVSNLVKELMSLGLVYEADRRQEGRGAPSTVLALNPSGAYAIGLDLDRDHLTGVLVDLAGTVRQRIDVALDFPSPAEALELMVEAVDALVGSEGLTRDDLQGLGVGVPGPMHPAADGAGYVVSPKAFRGWQDVPLAQWLEAQLGLPVFLENNATAAAMGERWYGGGRQIQSFFYMYFGSGLGGGLIVQGQPHTGFTGNAGEIGYFPASAANGAENETPHVGLHFHLPQVYARLRAAGHEASRPEDLDALLDAGAPEFLEWIDRAAEHLTSLVLAVEYIVDPEAIFFGGRLSDRVLGLLMERMAERLPSRRVAEKDTAPRHLLAQAGADAAALGVATLPIYEFFAPAPRVLLKRKDRGERAMSRPRVAVAG